MVEQLERIWRLHSTCCVGKVKQIREKKESTSRSLSLNLDERLFVMNFVASRTAITPPNAYNLTVMLAVAGGDLIIIAPLAFRQIVSLQLVVHALFVVRHLIIHNDPPSCSLAVAVIVAAAVAVVQFPSFVVSDTSDKGYFITTISYRSVL